MRVSGMSMVRRMAVEFKSGLMAPSMKDIGVLIRPMVEEDLFMQMETFTMESGRTIKPMDTEFIITLMELAMKDTGSKISNMVMEKRSGQTMPATKVSIEMERNTERDNSCGLMDQPMKVISLKTTSMAWESILGPMEEDIMVSGSRIRWMAMESLLGAMAVNTKVNM